MTSASGFKVEANWDSCYKHFSTDTKLQVDAAKAVLGANAAADFSTVRDTMITNGDIKVTSLAGEAMPMDKIDEVMNPILPLVEAVILSADCISWGEGPEDCYIIKGQIRAGSCSQNFKLTEYESTQGFLVPRSADSIEAYHMQFISKTGKKYDWANNGKDLRALYPTLDFMVFDTEWKTQGAKEVIGDIPEPVKVR